MQYFTHDALRLQARDKLFLKRGFHIVVSVVSVVSSFHAKPGFDDISVLQKYKKATDFRLIS